jgi:hypothetical protein
VPDDGVAYTVYQSIGQFNDPRLDGGVHDINAELPLRIDTDIVEGAIVGALPGLKSIKLAVAPSPFSLIACKVVEYNVPFVNVISGGPTLNLLVVDVIVALLYTTEPSVVNTSLYPTIVPFGCNGGFH